MQLFIISSSMFEDRDVNYYVVGDVRFRIWSNELKFRHNIPGHDLLLIRLDLGYRSRVARS